MKKIVSLLLAALVALSLFAGCSLESNDPASTVDPNVTLDPSTPTDDPSSDIDLTAPVAEVGGEIITVADYKQMFDMYLAYFSSYGYDIASDPTSLKTFQDDVLNLLVSEKLPRIKANELGYANYTAEQQAELDTRVKTEIDGMRAYFTEQAELEKESNPELDVEARAMEMMLQEAAYNLNKEDATYEDYEAHVSGMVENEYLTELLKGELLKDVAVTDEEVDARYNELLTSQQEEYTATPSYYGEDVEGYEMNGGDPILYVPEGYSRFMHIFIPFEDALPTEYVTLGTDLDALRAEYGELAFAQALSGGSENAARLSEIISEYQRIEGERTAIYDAFVLTPRTTVNEIYARLQAGEEFAQVMKETTLDSAFTNYEAIMEHGRVISKTITLSSDISDSVIARFAELEIGQYSEVFDDDSGFHIIYYASDIAPGAVALADTGDAIRELLLTEKTDTEWKALIDSWYKDGTVVLHEDNYRSFGQPAG